MTFVLGVLVGVVLTIAVRIAMMRLLLIKLRRDVAALSAGDYGPLLAGFAPDAVLEFNEGEHRWSGTYAGRDRIESFLQMFVAAGLHGDVRRIWCGGWPWSMTVVARFDDAADVDGENLYANQTVLVCRTRWGRIVHQADYYVDTQRIVEFERRLTARGR
jgi:ketosteroid isomerase-like protein